MRGSSLKRYVVANSPEVLDLVLMIRNRKKKTTSSPSTSSKRTSPPTASPPVLSQRVQASQRPRWQTALARRSRRTGPPVGGEEFEGEIARTHESNTGWKSRSKLCWGAGLGCIVLRIGYWGSRSWACGCCGFAATAVDGKRARSRHVYIALFVVRVYRPTWFAIADLSLPPTVSLYVDGRKLSQLLWGRTAASLLSYSGFRRLQLCPSHDTAIHFLPVS